MNKEKPKVLGGIGEKKSNGGTQWYQQDRIYDNEIAISVTTAFNPWYVVPNKKEMLRMNKELEQMLDEYEKIDDDEILKKGKLKFDIYDKFGTDKKCFRCGSQLLISDLPDYDYLCFECDENMYEFEAR